MKRTALLNAFILATLVAFCQEDSLIEKNLDEVTVFVNKFAEKKKNLAQRIDVIGNRTIAGINAQNTGDLLINTGNVFIQKSQQGGSSPVLRGFEASRVLLVVDGVRMNNAIYRAGHLQNIITLDQNMVERVEVLYGPGSTIYGSDALGGVVHMRSKSPRLATENNFLSAGSGFLRYSSANDEKTGHIDLSLAGNKLGWLQSYTFSDFGDLKMGSDYPDNYPDFGRRDSLIAFFGFKDSVIKNNDPNVQKFSGYKQWDILQKILFNQSEKVNHVLNFQYSNTNNVPRYDRLQDKRNFGGTIGTTLRYAEWYYGPQERLLAAYELNAMIRGFLEEFRILVSYQGIEESRHQREYRRYDRFDSRAENLDVWGFNIDGRGFFGNNELTVGIDGQLNEVKSTATRKNLNTGAVSKLDTRYPDGDNKMSYYGLYAQHILKIKNNRWVLNDGIRVQVISLRSNIIDNSFFNLPVTEFEQDNFSITGNIGLVYLPSDLTRLSFGLSSGFRSPNIDDLVKIFDFSVARRVYVPNADIDPEYTYTADLTFSHQFKNKIRGEITAFYTLFDNAIVSAPFTLNGSDSILYNGVMSAVYANQNLNKANMYGINANLKIDFTPRLSFSSTGTYTYGRMQKFDGSGIPQDHIPPFYGKTSLSFQEPKYGMELYSLYNGWKKIKQYNPDGEDNLQYATVDGMPSWFTLNWRGNLSISKGVRLQLSVENILDRNYRYFASGFSASGRNFIVALRTSF